MFEINYSYSDTNNLDYSKSDDEAFRYDLFLGNITLTDNDVSINMNWGWIPIMDFALSIVEISKNLMKTPHASANLDFTESSESIFFGRKLDTVQISSSFSDAQITLPIEEFNTAVMIFFKKMINELLQKHTELVNNMTFKNYLNYLQQ